jgi:acetyl esterase/lipase
MKSAKNIAYINESAPGFDDRRHRLDVYYPDDKTSKEVLVFIHGGSWSQGNKELYGKLGEVLANKGAVCVIINYRLAPGVTFEKMALDCASAVKWVHDNISKYGGDKDKIFLSGHSAGGHLAALITLNKEFFKAIKARDIVKGCILIDAFGLNIHTLLREHQTAYNYLLHKVFTDKPELWDRGSPSYFLEGNKIPFLVWVGERTYPFVMLDNGMFVEQMEKAGQPLKWEMISGKSHHQMIMQLEQVKNPLYDKMIEFMRTGLRAGNS